MSTNPTAAASSPGKLPWYVPTPAKCLVLMLLAQMALYGSQQFEAFQIKESKGYAVLGTLAATSLLLLGLLVWPFLWQFVGRFFQTKPQFSLATLLLMIPVMAIPCAWLGQEYQQAEEQRKQVAAAVSQQLTVKLDKFLPDELAPSLLPPAVRKLLISWLGEDFFADAVGAGKGEIYESHDDDLKAVAGLTRLKNLAFVQSDVSDAGLAHLQGLTRLKRLELYGTWGFGSPDYSVTDRGLAHLQHCTNLEVLRIDHARISGAGLAHLSRCTKLRYLEFGAFDLTDENLKHLANHTEMERLILVGASINGSGLENLKGMQKLELLDLNGSTVTDAGMKHIGALAQLKELRLHQTNVTDAGLAELAGLKHLHTLDLGRNQKVTDAGLAHLHSLPALTSLEVIHTGVTAQGVSSLRKALPRCKIRQFEW
jgi:hypothetical protein